MEYGSIFAGVLPLFVFVVIDAFSGPKSALISAILIAFLELAFSYYYIGEVDWITGLSFGLVFVLALTSFWKNKSTYLKFQPVILGVLLSGIMIITYLMDRPLLLEMVTKYKHVIPQKFIYLMETPTMILLLEKSTLTVGLSLLLHAGLVAYSALRHSNWVWIAMRALGFYVFIFIGQIAAIIWVRQVV